MCDRRAGAQELTRADKAHKEHKEHEEHKGHTTYKEKRRAHIKPKEHLRSTMNIQGAQGVGIVCA